jgi:hypothetical protein
VARAAEDAAAADPYGPDPEASASVFEPCGTCDGEAGRWECGACGGAGHVRRERPRAEDQAWLEALDEFLVEWSFIRRHGLAVWMHMHGDPDPVFIEAIELFDRELESEQQSLRVEWARKARAKQNK